MSQIAGKGALGFTFSGGAYPLAGACLRHAQVPAITYNYAPPVSRFLDTLLYACSKQNLLNLRHLHGEADFVHLCF